MSGKQIVKASVVGGRELASPWSGARYSSASSPIVELLWRRRATLAASVAVCVAVAAVYLLLATRVYTSAAKLAIEQNVPRVFSENPTPAPYSETFLLNQVQNLESSPVLMRALEAVDYRQMKTFAGVKGNPVEWLTHGSSFKVNVGKKDDIVTVSMDSPYPHEATTFVNGVIDAYLSRLSRQHASTGEAMVGILTRQRQELETRRGAAVQALVDFKNKNGVVSFRDEKGNIGLERLAALSSSLTKAELATLDLRSQYSAAKAVLDDPAKVAAFVEGLQTKSRDSSDKEYDDLRSQLQQYSLTLRADLEMIGAQNRRARALNADIDLIKQKIAEKEHAIAEAHLLGLQVELASAVDQEKQVRASVDAERKLAVDLNPKAAAYTKLETDLDRLQKQCDVLDSRIQEVSVNSRDAGSLSVEVLDPARADESPIAPRKSLTLAIAILAGLGIGTTLCMAQEWRAERVQTPAEMAQQLELPLLGAIPRIAEAVTLEERGQMLRLDPAAAAAEAYRGVHSAVEIGTGSEAKTLLFTAPAKGEDKSTSASNLAIAYAQAGQRTLLVDCDLRNPLQHSIFALDSVAGLADVLAGSRKLNEVIRRTPVEELFLLPCGTPPAARTATLDGNHFDLVMRALASTFDRIVIDASFLDARAFAASADATIVVSRMNQSMQKLASLTLDELQKVGANVLGVIATDVPAGSRRGAEGERWLFTSDVERQEPRLPAERKAEDRKSENGSGKMPDDILAITDPNWLGENEWETTSRNRGTRTAGRS